MTRSLTHQSIDLPWYGWRANGLHRLPLWVAAREPREQQMDVVVDDILLVGGLAKPSKAEPDLLVAHRPGNEGVALSWGAFKRARTAALANPAHIL